MSNKRKATLGEDCPGCGENFLCMSKHLSRRAQCQKRVVEIAALEEKAGEDVPMVADTGASTKAFHTVMKAAVARDLADFRYGGSMKMVSGSAVDGFKQATASWLSSCEASLIGALAPHISEASGIDVAELVRSRLDIFSDIHTAKLEEKELISSTLGPRWVAPRRRLMPGSDSDCVWDIPLIEQLQALITYDRSAAEQIMQSSKQWQSAASAPPPTSAQRVFRDLPHGDVFQQHTKLGVGSIPMPCVSGGDGEKTCWKKYYDDVESANPIGVARGVHSIGAVYVSCVNLDPVTRNRMEYIFVVCLALTSVIKKYGMLAVISGADLQGNIRAEAEYSLGAQMRALDAGVNLTYPADGAFGGVVERTTYGWMLMACADFPAAAKLLCTAASTSGKKPCRQCNWERESKDAHAPSSFVEGRIPQRWELRSLDATDMVLEEASLLSSKTARASIMRENGIYATHWAFHPRYFPHLPDPFACLPQDGMHALFSSGIVTTAGAEVLYVFISVLKAFTVKELNDQYDDYDWDTPEHKPPHIHPSIAEGAKGGIPSADAKLRYTGSQTMHFALNSRALLEPLLHENVSHPAWIAWLALVDVVEQYVADSFTMASITALDRAISKYIRLYQKVPQFKNRLRPKHHFLTHTARDIINFGPPRQYWCFGYEAKNQQMKRAAAASNYKDVIKTAAKTVAVQSAKSLLDRS